MPNYICFSTEKAIVNEDGCFQSTYVRKEYKVLKSEPMLGIDPYIGLGLYTKIETKNGILNIASIHGVAQPGDKLDNPKRLEQSKKIIEKDFTFDKMTRGFEKAIIYALTNKKKKIILKNIN